MDRVADRDETNRPARREEVTEPAAVVDVDVVGTEVVDVAVVPRYAAGPVVPAAAADACGGTIAAAETLLIFPTLNVTSQQ
jgi:hypothetical protein